MCYALAHSALAQSTLTLACYALAYYMLVLTYSAPAHSALSHSALVHSAQAGAALAGSGAPGNGAPGAGALGAEAGVLALAYSIVSFSLLCPIVSFYCCVSATTLCAGAGVRILSAAASVLHPVFLVVVFWRWHTRRWQ